MDAYIAGLLHDMGKLLVLKALISVIENDKDTIRLTKVVADEFLDAMHAEYGFSLLSKWNLPEAYCDICKNHHLTRYDTTNTLLTAVRLANQACKLGFGIHHDKDLQLETSLEAACSVCPILLWRNWKSPWKIMLPAWDRGLLIN